VSVTLDKAGRKLDGKYAPPQTAAHPLVHAFTAFGRGEGDRRRTSAAFRGIDVGPVVHAGDVDMDGGEVREVDLDKLSIGKGHLVRGRLARAAKTMSGKPRAEGDGIKPITVMERADKLGHYIVVRDHGEHRVAALKLNGHSAKVPVRVVKTRGAAQEEKTRWISDKIALLIGEGREQTQAVAMAHAMWDKDHGVAKIMTTGVTGAGAEFAPTNVMPGSPQKVSERRATVRAERRRRQKRLKKADSKPAIDAQVTNEIKRRINALVTAVAGLGEETTVQRLRRAARLVSREVSRAKRARAIPGPLKRAIEAAQAAVTAAFRVHGVPEGAVYVKKLDKHSEATSMTTAVAPLPDHTFYPVVSGDMEKKANVVKLPVADADTAWDGDAADKRIRVWAGAKSASDLEGIDWKKYGKAFLWWTTATPEGLGQFKLPVADVVDGDLKLVRAAIIAARGALSGARGGIDIPESEKKALFSATGDMFDKWKMDKYGTSEGAVAGHATQGHEGEGGSGTAKTPTERAGIDPKEVVAVNSPERQLRLKAVDAYAKADRLLARDGFRREDLGRTTVSLDDRYKMAQEKSDGDKKETARVYGYLRQSYEADRKGDNFSGKADELASGYEKSALGKAERDSMDNKAMAVRMKHVKTRMDADGIDAADLAEESDLEEEHVKAMLAGEHEPSDADMEAMEEAMDELCKADDTTNGATGDAILDAGGDGAGHVQAESEDMGPDLYEERDAINDAIRAKYGAGYYVCGVYPRSGFVLFRYCQPYVPGMPMEHGGGSKDKTFRAQYDEDADGAIVIGAAEEVQRKVVFEPVVKSADGRLTYNGKRIEDGKWELLAPHGEEDILAEHLAKSDLFEEVEIIEGVGVRVRLASDAMAKHGKADVLQVSGPFRVEEVERTEYVTEFLDTPDALAKGRERGIVYLKVYGPMEKDTQGEHANEEDIYDAAVGWMLRGAKINLMHKGKPTNDKVVFSDVTRVEGDLGLRKGTWFIAVKPTKENLARFKSGELSGASMEGSKVVVGSEEIEIA